MTKLKQEILDILAQDARTGVDKIAVMLGASVADVETAVRALEDSGVIVKYTTLINSDKLEREMVEALIEVRVSPSYTQGFDAIAEEIYKFEEVKSLFLMSGGYDLAVFVEGRSLKDVAMFVSGKLSNIDKVLSTATHFILKRYKSGGVLIEDGSENERLAVHA